MFIFIDDMESEQWNIVVDGKEKCVLVYMFFMKMVESFSNSGFCYYGQGKWYFGELLFCW